jgi:hypothetical protein
MDCTDCRFHAEDSARTDFVEEFGRQPEAAELDSRVTSYMSMADELGWHESHEEAA